MRTLITVFLVSFTLAAVAQSSFRATGVTMTIDGTSNVHDWTSKVEQVQVSGQFLADAGQPSDVTGLNVKIPVKSIKSGKSIMDKKTYAAMKSDKFPHVTFQAKQVSVSGNLIKAQGTLSIAGKSKPVTITGKWAKKSGGMMAITGSVPLKMTDFGIDPPTALMGTMTTGNEITINFTVDLKG